MRSALAGNAAKLARKSGFKPQLVDFADLDARDAAKAKRLDRGRRDLGRRRAARAGDARLCGADGPPAPRLDGVDFAVLALGDTAYADSARSARRSTRGSPRSAACGRSTASIAISTSRSRPATGSKSALERSRRRAPRRATSSRSTSRPRAGGEVSREPVAAEIVEHINLNSSRSDKETVHLALGFDGAAPAYEPGDSLELFPENDPALVDAVLAADGS